MADAPDNVTLLLGAVRNGEEKFDRCVAVAETSEMWSVSTATLGRDRAVAKGWLHRRLVKGEG